MTAAWRIDLLVAKNVTLRLGGSKNIQFTSGLQKGVKKMVAGSRWIGGYRILVRPLLSPKANGQTAHIRAHEHALQRLFHSAHTCTCTGAQDTCLVHATPTIKDEQRDRDLGPTRRFGTLD